MPYLQQINANLHFYTTEKVLQKALTLTLEEEESVAIRHRESVNILTDNRLRAQHTRRK